MEIKTWLKLYIAPNVDLTNLLGEDWLIKNRAQINFNPRQLKLKGIKIPLGVNKVVSSISTY